MRIPVNQILSSIGSVFTKCVTTVKNNGILFSTWAALLIIVIYTCIVNPININEIIKNNEKEKTEEHDRNVDKRLIADQFVPPILENIRLKYSLDRVSLLEMHNSTKNINGTSFLYMSMTYENISDSLEYISDNYQSQRTGNYFDLFNEMKRDGYVLLNDMSIKEYPKYKRLVSRMLKNGTHSALFIPIFDKDFKIISILVLSSTSKEINNSIVLGVQKYISEIKKLII